MTTIRPTLRRMQCHTRPHVRRTVYASQKLPNIGGQSWGSQSPSATPTIASSSYWMLKPAQMFPQYAYELSAWKIGPCDQAGNRSAARDEVIGLLVMYKLTRSATTK